MYSTTQMVPHLFADDLTVWKPEGVDWKLESSLDQLEQLFKLTDDLKHFNPVIESQYLKVCVVLLLFKISLVKRNHFLAIIS